MIARCRARSSRVPRSKRALSRPFPASFATSRVAGMFTRLGCAGPVHADRVVRAAGVSRSALLQNAGATPAAHSSSSRSAGRHAPRSTSRRRVHIIHVWVGRGRRSRRGWLGYERPGRGSPTGLLARRLSRRWRRRHRSAEASGRGAPPRRSGRRPLRHRRRAGGAERSADSRVRARLR